MDRNTWLIYLLAATGLSLSPGPNGMLALSAMTNPKGLLFFAAFLPQFIDPSRSLLVQFAILAGTFATIEIAIEMLIASMAHRISPWLRRVGRRFNQACGGVFMAIGVALPLRG